MSSHGRSPVGHTGPAPPPDDRPGWGTRSGAPSTPPVYRGSTPRIRSSASAIVAVLVPRASYMAARRASRTGTRALTSSWRVKIWVVSPSATTQSPGSGPRWIDDTLIWTRRTVLTSKEMGDAHRAPRRETYHRTGGGAPTGAGPTRRNLPYPAALLRRAAGIWPPRDPALSRGSPAASRRDRASAGPACAEACPGPPLALVLPSG